MRQLRCVAVGIALVIGAAFAAPTARAAIFGLLDTSELYSSTNAGATWAILATLPVYDAVGLAAGSSTSDLFIVIRSGSVYHSSNGGANWTGVGAVSASDVASFTINDDASLLLLTESGTLYRSTDGGASFSGLAALTATNFISLARGPLGRLYALSRTGEVYESQNQGDTWTAVGSVAVSNAVSMSRKAAELYILTETGEAYRSIDYGRSWLPVGAITASNMTAILDVGTSLLAAAGTGEIYSSSNGTGWSVVGAINQAKVVSLGADTPLATGVPVEGTLPPITARSPYPNPTTRLSGSTFGFVTSSPAEVRLEVYDVQGRRLVELRTGPFAAGLHQVPWKPSLPAGTYLVRITSGSGHASSVKWSVVD